MFFTIWVMLWNISRIQNIKSSYYIIFLKFFPIFFFWYKIYYFSVISIELYYGLIFAAYFRSFFTSSWFNAPVTACWKHILWFLLMGFIVAFCFLFNQENLYMIHQDSNLFYDICNTINEHNRRQTHYLS